MALLQINFPFDGDQVADKFLGHLTFRGAPADRDGVTEVEGDVDGERLLRAIRAARLPAPASGGPRPLAASVVALEPQVVRTPWSVLTVVAAAAGVVGGVLGAVAF